ncbi:heparan-alpha-glucosaminide N-acetyltransferase-like isoform X1 [Apostichopus japonicus]|uniref:heparan-alpha-glucosaminide N-acetyltransferase-like isoform X1 n=2 Tax=Stichopus japonicus TaxID=307972 RepID=UPI003AB3E27E
MLLRFNCGPGCSIINMERPITNMANYIVLYLLASSILQCGVTQAQDDHLSDDICFSEYSCNVGQDSNYFEAERDVLGLHHIGYDTAEVTIQNSLPNTMENSINVSLQSTECYQCKLLHIATVDARMNTTIKVDTAWPTEWLISSTSISTAHNCNNTVHFGENGRYTISIAFIDAQRSVANCTFTTPGRPQNANLPIYIAISVYVGIAVIYIILLQLKRSGLFTKLLSCLSVDRLVDSDLGTPTLNATEITINNSKAKKKTRLRSLDTFRGIAICIMIFVNYGGGKYWFFLHSRWNGITVADLAFPWFVFIMGTSIKLSQVSLYSRGVKRRKIFLKILTRTLILFGLGLILDAGNDLSLYRVPGVLQRLAASYFVGATLQLLSLKPPNEERLRNKFYRLFADIFDYWYEWVLIILSMVAYCCVSYLVAADGCPKGYLGPGGDNLKDSSLSSCTGGVAGAIDRWLFTKNHIYQRPTCIILYNTSVPYDPEGALGTITSIFLTFLGIQASKIISTYHSPTSRLSRFLIWGVITGGLAAILCGVSKNDGWIPINKNLWSPSYVLASAGMAFILLAFCYFVIDVMNWWSGVPFFYAGMNSILIYIGHEILVTFAFPFSWKAIHDTHAEHLAMNLIGVSLWIVISMWLYYIEFFLKI